MYLKLRDDLSFCESDGQIIFLDLRADRYFRLPADAEARFRRHIGTIPLFEQDAVGLEPAGCAALIDRGLLVPASHPKPLRPAPIDLADSSLAETHRNRRVGATLALSIFDQIRARRLLKRPLLFNIQRIASCRAASEAAGRVTGGDRVMNIAEAYRRSRALISQHDHCLLKSLALAMRLARIGAPATLVFGVRARPFAAHCWVQYDSMVLNDSVEHVHSFTPILAT